MRATYDFFGALQPNFQLRCRNSIPQSRGLGSSAAAIVTGIRLAEALLAGASLSGTDALRIATDLEGHCDNVAACLLGQFTIAWTDEAGPGYLAAEAVSLGVHPKVRTVAFIPPDAMSTQDARRMLPEAVRHLDAARNSGRAALLAAALTLRPDVLFAATEDRLHQEFRRPAMSSSLRLVDELRAAGEAAVVSGAGPTVLVLTTTSLPSELFAWCPGGWQARELAVDLRGAHLV